jgi:hypothetical protein
MPTIELKGYDLEVLERLTEAKSGKMASQYWCKEEMVRALETVSSSDFKGNFFGAFANVQQYIMQSKLAEEPLIWPEIAARRTVPDPTRVTKMMRLNVDTRGLPDSNGGEPRVPGTLPRVPELTEYPVINWQATAEEMDTAKNGARIAFSFESLFADQWNVLDTLPGELAQLERAGQETQVLNQYFTPAGFNTDYFVPGTNLASNPALNFDSLKAAITKASAPPPIVAGQERPLLRPVSKWKLVVGPGLELTARALLSIQQYKETVSSGVETISSGNPFGSVELVVVPYLSTYYFSGAPSLRGTAWALVPAGGESAWGPTVSNVFLAGLEEAELRIRMDAGRYIGGGDVNPYDGSFDDDSIQLRIRKFYKGNTHNAGLNSVYSKGDGTATVTS